MNTRTVIRQSIWILPLALFLIAGTSLSRAAEAPEPRVNATSEGAGTQRGRFGGGTRSTVEFGALTTAGDRRAPLRSSGQLENGQQKLSRAPNTDFWFFDTDVQLFSDFDGDGYFAGIDLLFDADTVFSEADVYAVIYLSLDLGPWNEYAVTDDFTLFGATADDEYVVETELVSGYPTGEYDILIELFDAFDGTFLASIGPEDTSDLSFLPLEDANRDTPIDTQIFISSSGGGGATGVLSLLALFAAIAVRRQRSQA